MGVVRIRPNLLVILVHLPLIVGPVPLVGRAIKIATHGIIMKRNITITNLVLHLVHLLLLNLIQFNHLNHPPNHVKISKSRLHRKLLLLQQI
jgi:hypothetical protein